MSQKRGHLFYFYKISAPIKLYNKSYFEAGRRPRKRSLPSVNEHFEDKPDAKRALFDNFIPVPYNAMAICQYAA